ncbi:MAG: GrpB family protein [Chloroflexi bacterium]|nr:GrpB family protein [Chloroflexota bacterium]
MITIVPYDPRWPAEFAAIRATLQEALGDLALRIDHIGSTAVPGLAAKDRIDIQITVRALSLEAEAALARYGYTRSLRNVGDHCPPGYEGLASEWEKWFFNPPDIHRPANIHMRIQGRANQRYALLCRDYLRTHPMAAQAYGQVKMALARYHANDIDAYYDVKDPVFDIIMAGAEEWAQSTQWQTLD